MRRDESHVTSRVWKDIGAEEGQRKDGEAIGLQLVTSAPTLKHLCDQ